MLRSLKIMSSFSVFLTVILFSCEKSNDLLITKNPPKKDCSILLFQIDKPTQAQLKIQFASDKKKMSRQILKLINAHRKSLGLNKLHPSPIAKYLASKHNDYQISKGEISHDNLNFRYCFLINFAYASSVGENVASGYKITKSVVNKWLKSEAHKKNIEGNFSNIGIAVTSDNNDKLYYSTIFF